MATTNGTVVFYNSFFEIMGAGFNLKTDTFKVGLTTSSYTPSLSHTALANITNECSGFGYARQTLTNVVYTQTSGVAKFDFDDPVFTASGGSIVARYFFIYDDTDGSKSLVCYGLLDSTPADVTTTSGNTLTINIDVNGLFQLQLGS